MAKLRRGEWVRVTWFDACSVHKVDWMKPRRARKRSQLGKCRTAGYVLKLSRRCVVLSQNIGLNRKGRLDDVAHTIAIPRAWITKVKVL